MSGSSQGDLPTAAPAATDEQDASRQPTAASELGSRNSDTPLEGQAPPVAQTAEPISPSESANSTAAKGPDEPADAETRLSARTAETQSKDEAPRSDNPPQPRESTDGETPDDSTPLRRRRVRRSAATADKLGDMVTTSREPEPSRPSSPGARTRRTKVRRESGRGDRKPVRSSERGRPRGAIQHLAEDPSDQLVRPRRRRKTSRRTRTSPETSETATTARQTAPTERRASRPPQRRVAKQQSKPPPPAKPEKPKAQPTSKKEVKAEQAKITMILHPAPKATGAHRKKGDRPKTAKEALKAKLAKRASTRPKAAKEGSTKSAPEPAELSEQWLNAAGSEAYDCVRQAGELATALVNGWLERGNAEALVEVALGNVRSDDDEPPKAVRKAAKRALNVLKSRGVDIPQPTATQEASFGPAAGREAEPLVATFVPPDANGMVFFSISQREPGGRYRVADVVVRGGQGIMHASSGRIAGKQIRKWRDRVESRLGTAPVEVPVEWARFRIAAARKENDVSKQVLPLGLDSCAALFEPIPEDEPIHPVADLEQQLDDQEVTTAGELSEQLHSEPEFRSWLPDREALDDLLRSVGAKLGPEGAQDSELVDKTLEEEISAATDRFFSPQARESLAARMRDSAISIRLRSGDKEGQRVLAVAQAVRQAGLVTSPPRDIPFLTGFFRKAMAMLAHQGQGKVQIPLGAPPMPPAEPEAEPALGADSNEQPSAAEAGAEE